MRNLSRRPQRAVVVVGDVVGNAAAGLHRGREDALLRDTLLEHEVGLCEDRVDVSGGKCGVPSDVVGTVALHERTARLHRLLEVHHGRERLVVDVTSCAASSAKYRSSAMTTATGSPW